MGAASSRALGLSPTKSRHPSSSRLLSIDDFNHVPSLPLERGTNSRPYVVRRRQDANLFVVKARSKGLLVQNDELEIPRAELEVARILQAHGNPFVLPILATFCSPSYFCILTPFNPHDNLLSLLQQRDSPLPLEHARFYAAETCLALGFLHFHGILLRYLELQHIRLQPDGHVKISGFANCKTGMSVTSRTRTFRGNQEGMAPEVLLGSPYGFAVDWWAFGQVLYSMLARLSAFRGEHEDEIYDAILSGSSFYFPQGFDQNAAMLVNELSDIEPDVRLGSGRTDAEEIMSHVFFQDVDWEKLLRKEVVPPALPSAREVPAVSLDEMPLSMIVPPPDYALTQSQQSFFADFDFTANTMI